MKIIDLSQHLFSIKLGNNLLSITDVKQNIFLLSCHSKIVNINNIFSIRVSLRNNLPKLYKNERN